MRVGVPCRCCVSSLWQRVRRGCVHCTSVTYASGCERVCSIHSVWAMLLPESLGQMYGHACARHVKATRCLGLDSQPRRIVWMVSRAYPMLDLWCREGVSSWLLLSRVQWRRSDGVRELQEVPASFPAGVTCQTQNHCFWSAVSHLMVTPLLCVRVLVARNKFRLQLKLCSVYALVLKCRV
jgi:hypothetical protein